MGGSLQLVQGMWVHAAESTPLAPRPTAWGTAHAGPCSGRSQVAGSHRAKDTETHVQIRVWTQPLTSRVIRLGRSSYFPYCPCEEGPVMDLAQGQEEWRVGRCPQPWMGPAPAGESA